MEAFKIIGLSAGIGESLVFIEFPRFGLLGAIVPRRHRNPVIVHVHRRFVIVSALRRRQLKTSRSNSSWVFARCELVSSGG
jgi:hypothetical protein